MSWSREVNAMNISGECQTWAMQFNCQARMNATDERVAELLHDMILDFQKMERKIKRQIKAVER